MSKNVKASVLTITSFLTHCDCPVPVDLIYTMENGFVPLKNCLIQHESKRFQVKDEMQERLFW